MSVDYKKTVRLPQTDFPMKAGLPKREPELLQRWADMDLWGRMREASKGREPFILHDGPPYANGNLHIGHALNKILKDVINRSQQMMGTDANYVPLGLPRPADRVEDRRKYRAEGKDRMRFRSRSSAKNAVSSQTIGLTSNARNSNALASWAIGTTPIRRWPTMPRRASRQRSENS